VAIALDNSTAYKTSKILISHRQATTMYHLDVNPSPSDQTLFKDLLKVTTAKWQTMFKKSEVSAQADTITRPSVSRSSTQASVPESKT
jgi:hypothetical protein